VGGRYVAGYDVLFTEQMRVTAILLPILDQAEAAKAKIVVGPADVPTEMTDRRGEAFLRGRLRLCGEAVEAVMPGTMVKAFSYARARSRATKRSSRGGGDVSVV
jgi:hypothetical protein